MPPVTMDDFNSYLSPYVGDQAKLALLLDYDGKLYFISKPIQNDYIGHEQ